LFKIQCFKFKVIYLQMNGDLYYTFFFLFSMDSTYGENLAGFVCCRHY